MLGGAEGGVCLAMCRFVVGTERRSIPKVASLLEHHLKIDPLSLFKSEGAKLVSCAGQTFTHKHAASLTSQ